MSAVLNVTVKTASSALCGQAVCGRAVCGQRTSGAIASDQLSAVLVPVLSIRAALKNADALFATITQGPMMVTNCPDYEGEYEIRPAVYAQELETSAKRMKQNLLVQKIPYAEVTNIAGGTTVTIG